MSGRQSSKKAKMERTSVDDKVKRNHVPPVAAASPPVAQGKRCEIFKLDVDCCEEIFEWLSITDLHSFGQTCKRMNRIAGMYFRQNYPGLKVKSGFGKIYCDSSRLDGFSEFIENVTLICDASHAQQLKYIESNCKSLKAIEFIVYDSFISNRLFLIRNVLAKIESVNIVQSCPNENILGFCPNLRKFKCCWKNTDSLLKLNKCPKLEHINLEDIYATPLNVQAIFPQIPNVRNVQVSWHSLVDNKSSWLSVNATVENLTIHLEGIAEEDGSFFATLTELHGRGLYKRLHFTCVGLNEIPINQQLTDKIASVRALETLEICEVENGVVWPIMHNITKICIHNRDQLDLTTFPAKVPNLQRLSTFVPFDAAPDRSIDTIFAFVRSSKLLSKILWHDKSNESILDLSALNKERKKLAGACKVNIYVHNELFLATKLANGLSRSLVEIKRLESLQLNDFDKWYFD